MSELKFEGTPWETSSVVNTDGETIWDVCEAEAGDMVAEICGHGDAAESRANLIAAAPETAAERDRLKESNAELLAALKGMVEAFEDEHGGGPYLVPSALPVARNAIAKAETP